MTYAFNKEKHAHTLDDKPLMGVTTVLSVISKPALIQWSANMAVDYVKTSRVWQLVPETPRMIMIGDKELETLLEEARTAHRRKKEDAGQKGTDVHSDIENLLKVAINDCGGIINEDIKSDNPSVQNFITWAKENKVKFLESEKHLYSEKLWVGGISDMVFEMNGKKYIGDVKTSSAIYNEAFFQMGAYNLCLEEMGEHKDVEGYLVINLKKDGTMSLKMAVDMEINKNAFLSALSLYKIIQSLEK